MKVWILTAKSESGDDYGPWVFRKPPTNAEITKFLLKRVPSEFEGGDGPGHAGSYLHVTLVESETERGA